MGDPATVHESATVSDMKCGVGAMEKEHCGHPAWIDHTEKEADVCFQNVPENYILDFAVECHYTVPPGVALNCNDWIGLFPVRWASHHDYYTFSWTSLPDDNRVSEFRTCKVQFKAYYLPKDCDKEYVFCFVTRRGDVRGVSSSFKFLPQPCTHMEEVLVLEDDDVLDGSDGSSDALLVTTRSRMLQTQLAEAQMQNGILSKERAELHCEAVQLHSVVDRLQGELDVKHSYCADLQGQNSVHSSTDCEEDLKDMTERLTRERKAIQAQRDQDVCQTQFLEAKLQALRVELSLVLSEAASLSEQNVSLKDENEKIGRRLHKVEEEKKLYKEHLRIRELDEQELARELVALHEQLAEKQGQGQCYQDQLKLCRKQLQEVLCEKEELAHVREKLRLVEDEHAGDAQRLKLLGEELRRAANTRDTTAAELHRQRINCDCLRSRIISSQHAAEDSLTAWELERERFVQQAKSDQVTALSENLQKLLLSLREERRLAGGLQRRLAQQEDCTKVQLSEKLREFREMKATLAVMSNDRQQLQQDNEELQSRLIALESRLGATTEPQLVFNAIHESSSQDSFNHLITLSVDDAGTHRRGAKDVDDAHHQQAVTTAREAHGADPVRIDADGRTSNLQDARSSVVCSQPGPSPPPKDGAFSWEDFPCGSFEEEASKTSCSSLHSSVSRPHEYLDFESLGLESSFAASDKKDFARCGMVFPPAYSYDLIEGHSSKH
uniref:calcium-binding and coiled-coil domain-containing protein 1-like isoform X3 n=1 Tax=Myxine glutinosa TaxID=7769 RepID=UPI00358F6F22